MIMNYGIGDNVIIRMPRTAYEKEKDPVWVSEMDQYDGITGVIDHISLSGYIRIIADQEEYSGVHGFLFHESWLERSEDFEYSELKINELF